MTESTPVWKGPQLHGKRVLVVDDNDRYAEAISEDLQSRGVEVANIVRTVNAEDGVNLLRSDGDTFDLVVSDISMEGQISGLRVLRCAKKDHKHLTLACATTGLDTRVGYAFNYIVLGKLYRCDYLIPKRPIKREGVVKWLKVGGAV